MKLIQITKGYSAMVDDADFEWLNQWKWFAMVDKNTVYAVRTFIDNDKRKSTIRMHRQILSLTDPKILGEHADGNGLNNQRDNLRPCTRSQNGMNRDGNPNTSSKFKGVCWDKSINGWIAQIKVGGISKHIGRFDNEEDAARAYNQLAKKNYGEFARYNNVSPMFPDQEWSPKVIMRHNRSGFRGVSFETKVGKWRSAIKSKIKSKHLGYFSDPIEAAKVYDQAAIEIYGDSAKLNFPIIDAGLAKEITNTNT